MSDEVVTFAVPLAGRDVLFRRAHLGQVLMLQRIFERNLKKARESGEENAEAAAFTTGVSRTLDFIETLIVNDEDKQFIEDQMLLGNIDYMELTAVLSGGAKAEQQADDEAPAVKKRTPRKADKTAKTVTPRARAKR